MKLPRKVLLALVALCVASPAVLQAQQAAVSAGAQATGAGGSVAFSIGLVAYDDPAGSGFSAQQGVQQAYSLYPWMWTGNVDTDWHDPGNWQGGTLPTANDSVGIPTSPTGGNFPMISGTAVSEDLTVQPGATVTVSSGHSITVHGVLTNNGTVNVENNGSLVQTVGSTLNPSATGTFNVARIGSAVYDYWSSPVENIPTSFLGGNVFQFHPATGTMDNADDNVGNGDPGWSAASGTMTAGRGYAAHGAGTRTFTGTVHNGPEQVAVEYHIPEAEPFSGNFEPGVPFNLIGNPYPSGIDITQFLSVNNASVLEDGTVYLWDDPGTDPNTFVTGDYAQMNNATYTAGGGGTPSTHPIIGSHQGFKVRVANGATQVQFSNAMRTAGNTASFFKQEERRLLWLSALSSGNSYNQTAVGFFDDGTDGPDWGYDAPKLNGMGVMSLYSLMDDSPYGIQVYGQFNPAREVPLGVHCGEAQTVTFRLDSTQYLDNEDIYLEDRLLGIFHDLNQADYPIALGQGPHEGRFFLRFDTELVTGIRTPAFTWKPTAYIYDGMLRVGGPSKAISHLTLMDMSGRVVWEERHVSLAPSKKSFDLNRLSAGIYTLRIVNAHGMFAQKLLR